MRFTDNASIATDTMVNDDILAGTDVSTGNDRKFTLANLAAWLLNKFNGLSLAGSNQTVKSAIDSLNSNLTNLSSGTILDYVKSQVSAGVPEGHFFATSAVTDIPVSGNWFVSYVRNTGSNIVQLKATQYNDSRVIYNTHIGNYQSSTAFASGWTQEPTRAEMDAVTAALGNLENTRYYQASTGQTETYTLPTATLYLFVCCRINQTATDNIGLYIIAPHTTNSAIYPVKESQGMVASISGKTLTLTNNATYMLGALIRVA